MYHSALCATCDLVCLALPCVHFGPVCNGLSCTTVRSLGCGVRMVLGIGGVALCAFWSRVQSRTCDIVCPVAPFGRHCVPLGLGLGLRCAVRVRIPAPLQGPGNDRKSVEVSKKVFF